MKSCKGCVLFLLQYCDSMLAYLEEMKKTQAAVALDDLAKFEKQRVRESEVGLLGESSKAASTTGPNNSHQTITLLLEQSPVPPFCKFQPTLGDIPFSSSIWV